MRSELIEKEYLSIFVHYYAWLMSYGSHECYIDIIILVVPRDNRDGLPRGWEGDTETWMNNSLDKVMNYQPAPKQ